MKSTIDRRQAILEYLIDNRRTTRKNLADRFGVSKRTIERDILVLSCSYPIETQQGGGGGIFIAEGYRLGMKYLNDEQIALLDKLTYKLSGDDLAIMQSIIRNFKKPISIKS